MALDTVASGAVLDAIAPAFERGELTPPPIAGKVSLDQAAEAYGEVDSGRAKGKLVLVFRS